MVVLVTRPAPDNEATAEALRALGLVPVLAPMLTFQPLPFRADDDARHDGVILTSANVLRAIAGHPLLARLVGMPVFAVGERTAQAARQAGFGDVQSADGDAAALRELIGRTFSARRKAALLYLCAADVSVDLRAELAPRIAVTVLPVYRMAEVAELGDSLRAAFASNAIEAMLHYSRRSALAFVGAARRAGLEVSALALPQVCLSQPIASALREQGASWLVVARVPAESDLLDSLQQALRSRQ